MAAKRRKAAPKKATREYCVYQFTKDGKRKTVHTCSSASEANKLKAELAKKFTQNVYGVFWREPTGLDRRFAPKKAATKR